MTALRTLDQIRADRARAVDTRRLLAAIHRWARTNGWQPTLSCWSNRDRRIDVSWDDDQVSVFTDGHAWPVTYKATTVRQAIDHLVVAGVLPAEFSTQYEAGRRAA